MATHLLRRPKTLREIATAADIGEIDIREDYEDVYTDRWQLVEEERAEEYKWRFGECFESAASRPVVSEWHL